MQRINLIKVAALLVIGAVIGLVLYTVLYLSPAYKALLVKNTEREAIQSGKHLAFMFIHKDTQTLTQSDFSEETNRNISETTRSLDIQKLKIYSATGEIVFSTDPKEIGQINRNDYFTQIVAKGEPYTKTVRKKTPSAEGEPVSIDVVETYTPIIRQGRVIGIFEIYHDISESEARLNGLIIRIYTTLVPFTALFLVVIVTLALKVQKSFVQLRQTEARLQAAYSAVEQQVAERTESLKQANVALEEKIEQQKAYEEEIKLAASVFENSVEGILISDENGEILRVNNAFTVITGFTQEEALGQNPRILKSERHDNAFYANMWDSLKQQGFWKGEIWNRRKNGETYPEWLSITALKNPQGETTHFVAQFHDITEIKQSEERLQYQAHYDALTQLPNRQLFNDRLKMVMAQSRRSGMPVGILFLDLDDFKNINNSLGHYFGDLLLQQVAERLQRLCREEDTVARLGGDEFMLIAPSLQKREAAAIRLAERILESFNKPFDLEGKEVYSRASIGIAVYPYDGSDIETLVKNADVAMFRAKAQGKYRLAMFTEKMQQEVQRRVLLENDLRRGLANNEFKVFYQPKIDILTGTIVGMESLARWLRRKREFVPPSEFIPVAEDIGIIYALGDFVLSTACRQTREYQDAGYRNLRVSVNLSIKQFRQENLITKIEQALIKTGLAPDFLTIEITESIVITDVEAAIETMRRFKSIGIRISIDDFGTGYSSLSYLKKMPLSELKIDKSFVDDIPQDAEAVAIVQTILSLAKSLNLKTVAEGVETKEQMAFLRDSGCDEIQGYLFSKPLPAEEMSALLAEGIKL